MISTHPDGAHASRPRGRAISRRHAWRYGLQRIAEHVLGNNLLAREPLATWFDRAQERVLVAIQRDLARTGPGATLSVPIGDDPRAARRLLKPLLFPQQAKNWPCSHKWTLEFLADTAGDVPVNLIKDHIVEGNPVVGRTTIRGVIDSLDDERADYARFVPIIHRHPEFLDDLDLPWCASVIDDAGQLRLWGHKGPGTPLRSHLFVGRAGSVTQTHSELTANLFINVSGRKKWRLIAPGFLPALRSPVNRNPGVFNTYFDPDAPDYQSYPGMAHVDVYEVTLEPGDVLYVPPFYWHHVVTVTDNVSLGLRWYGFKDACRSSLLLNFLSAIATDPPMYRAIRDAVEYGDVHG